MNDVLVSTMKQGWSAEYDCATVILTAPADPDKVITYAHSIGAVSDLECEGDEPTDLVIDFRYADEAMGRAAGPELYTEEAVRSQLEHDLADAASAAK